MPQINPIQTGGGIVFATPADLIQKALQDIGVVGFAMPATAQEIQAGLQTLNAMLDMWGVLRENINVRKVESFTLTVGQASYQIGSQSIDFDTVRPIKIEQAYYRDANNTDFPLDVTMSEEQYTKIPIKNLVGNPTMIWYSPDWPFGTITFDVAPSIAWTLWLHSWKPFAKITDPNDLASMSYPDGYEAAILFNLEKLLCAPNKKQVPPVIDEMARQSLEGIQAAYGETPVVTNFDMPYGKKRVRGTFFDMNGGQ